MNECPFNTPLPFPSVHPTHSWVSLVSKYPGFRGAFTWVQLSPLKIKGSNASVASATLQMAHRCCTPLLLSLPPLPLLCLALCRSAAFPAAACCSLPLLQCHILGVHHLPPLLLISPGSGEPLSCCILVALHCNIVPTPGLRLSRSSNHWRETRTLNQNFTSHLSYLHLNSINSKSFPLSAIFDVCFNFIGCYWFLFYFWFSIHSSLKLFMVLALDSLVWDGNILSSSLFVMHF